MTNTLLALALVMSITGMAWLALAMEVHWQQVRDQQTLTRRTATTLRVLGVAAIVASLLLCLLADHVSMAVLVWIMALAAAALVVAFTFTWRPRWFAPLVAWVPLRRSGT